MSENNMRLLTAFRLEAVNSKTVHDGKYVLYDWAKGDFLTWAQIAAAARSLIPATPVPGSEARVAIPDMPLIQFLALRGGMSEAEAVEIGDRDSENSIALLSRAQAEGPSKLRRETARK